MTQSEEYTNSRLILNYFGFKNSTIFFVAYLLVDKGYDVWLGNSRGSIFSRNHSKFLSSSFGFWNFRYRKEKNLTISFI